MIRKDDTMTNWNLEEVYKNDEEWNKDFELFTSYVKDIVKFKGTLNDCNSSISSGLTITRISRPA